jgi:hypothetical protein
MFVRTLLLTTALTASAHAADFDRTLSVAGGPELTLSNGSGHVRITPGTDAAIHIHAHVYAGLNFGGDVEERIRRIAANPPIQQSGNSVRVGGDPGSDRSRFNNISIDYEITAPPAVALNLYTGSADVSVDHVGRSLKAESGSGAVRVYGLAGPADLHTGSGRIELQEQGSGDVHAATGSGSIRISGLAGSLSASTGSGAIEVEGRLTLHLGRAARVSVDAVTGSGNIRVMGAEAGQHHHLNEALNGGGPRLDIQVGSGSIEID